MTNPLKYKSSINTEHYNNLSRYKIKQSFKRQCHKSWPDIYKIFDRPKLKRSLSFDVIHCSDITTAINNEEILSPKLSVDYEQLVNDNVHSKNCHPLNENKFHNHNNIPKRIKRRAKLFTHSLKILEESDDDTRSIISDGSRTLIPYDEFPFSKYSGTSGLVSTYFPGQDLFKFLSSRQFVQADAELDRENAHFKISEAIIGTIEQVGI